MVLVIVDAASNFIFWHKASDLKQNGQVDYIDSGARLLLNFIDPERRKDKIDLGWIRTQNKYCRIFSSVLMILPLLLP